MGYTVYHGIYCIYIMERRTIFLVDDDIINLNTGKNALSGTYRVVTISSGELLLQMLEKTIPDLILLDIEMPGMNGYETIRAIKGKEETAHIPVIFLTAKDDSDSEMEGLTLGAVDYISKPFSPSLLLKRIEIHLLLVSQQKELINFNNNLQEMVREKTKSVVELQSAIIQTMAELIEYRDDVTGGHIGRTRSYLGILLEALEKSGAYKDEASQWDRELILQSAQLHDIGKIKIKDVVLLKADKLTPDEFAQIKEHTVFGKKIIDKVMERTTDHAFLEYAMVLVVSHHERWDGTGYPNGLKGEEIPLLGRLMAIADVYDALVSERPYKKAFSHSEAVKIITEDSGRHFDPKIVEVFLTAADDFWMVKPCIT